MLKAASKKHPIRAGLWLSCREAGRYLATTAAPTGDPGIRIRLALKLHLLVCGWCRAYRRRLRELSRLRRERPETLGAPTPAAWSEVARDRVLLALRRAGQAEVAAEPTRIAPGSTSGSAASPRGDGSAH